MSATPAGFEELDHQSSPIGAVSLRRRYDPLLEREIYEVKLDDEFLMSSLFTAAEVALADLALARLPARPLDVVVGGLGLGYTARAVLQDPRVRSMEVVELVGAVIDWHARHLVPCARTLTDDARCHFVQADFFDMVQRGALFGGQLVDAILADIDHSPRQVLHPSHAALYTADGLRRLAARLHPRGVFGLWSDGEPDDAVVALLGDEFAAATAHVVTFPNPYTGDDSSSTVYIATM